MNKLLNRCFIKNYSKTDIFIIESKNLVKFKYLYAFISFPGEFPAISTFFVDFNPPS